MKNALLYMGKKVVFNYNERLAYYNMIKNDDNYEIRKMHEESKSHALHQRLEVYL